MATLPSPVNVSSVISVAIIVLFFVDCAQDPGVLSRAREDAYAVVDSYQLRACLRVSRMIIVISSSNYMLYTGKIH